MPAHVTVIGAGAAGCFAALAARGALRRDGTVGAAAADAPSVLLVDGQDRPGRKILISGGGRCNVTNARVRPDDFVTATPRPLRTQLAEFGPTHVVRAFATMGVRLAEEPLGKLFPADGGTARDVVAALDAALAAAGVQRRNGTPVTTVAPRADGGWSVDGAPCDAVVLATGGRSVPATGSTGFGLDLAVALGHTLVPTVPALAALTGHADDRLAGLTVPAVLTAHLADGRVLRRTAGSLLFTHRGVSGPAALDLSEVVERRPEAHVTADLLSLHDPAGPFAPWLDAPKLPGACLPDTPAPVDVGGADAWLRAALDAAAGNGTLASVLRGRLPRRLAEVLAGAHADTPAGAVPKAVRRDVARALAALDLAVTGTSGYAKAEVTAGGVRLDELDRRTLESRIAPGLHLAGEVCDVTGRLGGFNFQWAWTSGALAGWGAAAGVSRPGTPG